MSGTLSRAVIAGRTATDFGGKLREARERRGVSVRDIANATKISAAALEALERNDISKLPGGIFSRAFVRSYAVEVGLDPESTIQEFVAAFANDSVAVGHSPSHEVDEDATESRRRTASTVVRLLAVAFPIAALVVYLGSAGRRGATTEPTANQASAAAAVAPTPAIPETPLPEPVTRPAPAAQSVPGATDAVTDAPDVLTIGLSVRTPCVISAVVDGRKTIDQVLRPGDRRTIEVHRDIVLTVGDAAAVIMTLNGADARPLGTAGEVVTARMNPATFKSYLSPR